MIAVAPVHSTPLSAFGVWGIVIPLLLGALGVIVVYRSFGRRRTPARYPGGLRAGRLSQGACGVFLIALSLAILGDYVPAVKHAFAPAAKPVLLGLFGLIVICAFRDTRAAR